MAQNWTSASGKSSGAWKRYLKIGVPIVVVILLAIWLLWPKVQVRLWLGELHSDDPRVQAAARDKLASSEIEGLNESLREVFVDSNTAFSVRVQVGQVLVRRNRLAWIEEALRSPSLDARIGALTVLHRRQQRAGSEWFKRDYLDNPAYAVVGTLKEWLRRDSDVSRRHAIDIATASQLEEVGPEIALVLDKALSPRSDAEQRLLRTAASAAFRFKLCDAVGQLVPLAENVKADTLRMSLIQSLYFGVRGPQASCPDALTEDEIKAIVLAGLESVPGTEQPHTRHAMLQLFQREPEWALENVAALRAVADGDTGDNEFHQRAALQALAATRDEGLLQTLPRYFHGPQHVRSTAVQSTLMYAHDTAAAPLRFESCWIGLLRDETENQASLGSALGGLKGAAGKQLIGLPADLAGDLRSRDDVFADLVKGLLERGEFRGVDRLAWADTWFEWFAKQLGLTEEEIKAALETQRAFWKAARAGKIEEARGVLARAEEAPVDLFRYERGWLEAQE